MALGRWLNILMEYKELLQVSEQLVFSFEFKEIENSLDFREPNIWQILNISRKEVLVDQHLFEIGLIG